MSMWLGHLFWQGGRQYALWSREDQLEVRPAQPADLLGLGLDLHAVFARARARDRRVLLALDVDDAHAARPEARQLRLVAQGRDLDAVVAADLEDRLALEALDRPAVDLDADARRGLRPLRRLGRQDALGVRVLERHDRVVLDRLVRPALGPIVQADAGTSRRSCRFGPAGPRTGAIRRLPRPGRPRRPGTTSLGGRSIRSVMRSPPVGSGGRRRPGTRRAGGARRPRRGSSAGRSASAGSPGARGRTGRSRRRRRTGRSGASRRRRARCRVGQPLADLGDAPQPDPARDGLAARLVGREAGQEPGQIDDAGAVVGNDHGAGSDVRADGAEVVERVRRVERARAAGCRRSARRRRRP